MKTTVERIDDTTVKLSVTVEPERVREALDRAARRLAGEIKVPGFRPGKAPRRVIETRVGKDAVVQEAVREALPALYEEAVRAEDVEVVGPPEFDLDTFEEGQESVFHATVEVRPEITLPDYGGLQVAHPEWEVTDEELDGQLEAMRDRFAELETVERAAQVGDHVVITVLGARDGEKVEEASAEDVLYEVRDGEQTDSELDRKLAGATAGQTLEFTDTLGPDYGELSGAEIAFTVDVKEVKEKHLPELDDEFAVTASEFDTLEELREALREQLAQQKLQLARAQLRGKVVEAVCDLVEVPLPKTMVDENVRFSLQRAFSEAQRHGLSFEQYLQAVGMDQESLLERLEEDARKTVKGQLVVDAIGKQIGVELTQEDLGEEIARNAMRLGAPPQEVAEFLSHPDRLPALVSDAYRRKAIDHLVATVQVLSAPPEEEPAPAGSGEASGEASGGEAEAAGES